jgi:hypothetical protein
VTAPPATAGAQGPIPDWRTTPDEPYPFVTPVPGLTPTEIDGIYSRPITVPSSTGAGYSTLTLRSGRFALVDRDRGRETGGHYFLSGGHVVLVNDPTCPDGRGAYRWWYGADGALELGLILDLCAGGARADELVDGPWALKVALGDGRRGYCQPPNPEAGITDHWPRPSDCAVGVIDG